MAAEQEWVCPICQDACKDIAYVVPCHHEFCLSCILRWGKQKKSCPLCRGDMELVKVTAWDDNEDLNFIIWPPAPPVPACFQEGIALNFSSSSPSSSPSLSPLPFSDEEEDEEADEETDEETDEEEDEEDEELEEEEAEDGPLVGGLRPLAWAQLFRQHQEILDPVLPGLRRELRAIFDTDWWPAMAAESFIFDALCDIGPNREELIELMWPALEDETETFIQGLLDTIVHQCREEAHRLLGLQGTHVSGAQEEGPAVRGQEDSRAAAPGPTAPPQVTLTSRPGLSGSTATSSREEQPRAGADIHAGPSHGPAAHTAREAERPCEEMEQEAAAGPSARGSSPSTPGQSSERARRPPKRRADSDQDPQPPCKRPPPQWD